MKKIFWISSAMILASPLAVFAVPATAVTDIDDFYSRFVYIVNEDLIPIILGLAFLVVIYGTFRYLVAADVKSKADGRTFVVYGIIGIAIMLSIWGLVYFVKNSFFSGAQRAPTELPKI